MGPTHPKKTSTDDLHGWVPYQSIEETKHAVELIMLPTCRGSTPVGSTNLPHNMWHKKHGYFIVPNTGNNPQNLK